MSENLWGYVKRLRFVRETVEEAFPNQPFSSLRVLDVGCGNGSELALPLAKLGFHVTGVDPHGPSIEHAKQLGCELTNISYICGTVEELNEGAYDVVILSEVLEHLREPEALLKASAKHLGSNSIMIVTVPNGYGEFEIDSYFFRRFQLQRIVDLVVNSRDRVMAATDNQDDRHVQFFTRRKLNSLFADCSLMVFREGSASFIAGPFVGHTLARSQRFIEWNSRITNKLPFVMASGWYFGLRKR